MSSKAAKGTTITFDTQIADVHSIRVSDGASEIDVTDLDSTEREFILDYSNIEVTCDVYGKSSIDRGDEGSLSVSWNDGGSDSLGTCVCTRRETSGAVGGAISTSLTFKPAP